MKILVLGAGVIGVSTAWELMRDGHEVTVIDRADEAASETSYANAGMVAPGHAFAWASPKVPKILWRALFSDDQAYRLTLSLDPQFIRWGLKFLGQCTAARALENTRRKNRLCRYSQERLKQVVAETGVQYDRVEGGLLFLYRSEASFEAGRRNMAVLIENGQEIRFLSTAEAAEIDPALAPVAERLAGASYAPFDESGDCALFTRALAVACEARGAAFRYGVEARALILDGDEISAVETSAGAMTADAYVMALGPWSPLLLKPVGIDAAIYPVKGYSVTFPTTGANGVPRIGGVDEDNLFAYCPMGTRLRMTATAHFAGYDKTHAPADFSKMLAAARELLPNAADYSQPEYWACLRPMTPNGAPLFGRGRPRNLWLNTGQGHMGWTMASGSAKVCADLIAGRAAEIDLTGMTLQ